MDQIVQTEKEPDMPYDFTSNIKLFFDPSGLYRYIQSLSILCEKCHEEKSIKFQKKFITIKCDCGIGILYPPRKDRGNKFLYVWKKKTKKQENDFL